MDKSALFHNHTLFAITQFVLTFVLKLVLARESHGSHVIALTLNKIVLVLCLILNSACDRHNAHMTYWCNCYHGNKSHELVDALTEVM